jgi:DNA polymerase III alpha subunit
VPDPSWIETQHVSVKMRTKGSMVKAPRKEGEADEKYEMTVADTAYIASAEQTLEDFRRYHPRLDQSVVEQAIANTDWVASQITPWLMDSSPKLPRYRNGQDPHAELRRQVYAGLEQLGHRQDQRYVEAVEKELEIYRQRGVSDFFLIVDDLVRASAPGRAQGRARPRVGGWLRHRLRPAHHADQPDQLRPALRALPQPRPRRAARHRPGLRARRR